MILATTNTENQRICLDLTIEKRMTIVTGYRMSTLEIEI